MIMMIKTSQEYASLVPQLSTEEYESLKQSIKENGLWFPIVVNKDGVILDGHHRYKACQELGIKAIKRIHEEERWHEIDKELQIHKLKLGNAIMELDKADKEFDELSADQQLNRPKLTEGQIAKMSKHERQAPTRELLDLFGKKLDKYLDVCKAAANMKFFMKYRIEQNNNIEFVVSETLKEMEELDLDKENGGVHFWARRAFEVMLLAAAAENNIADGVKYIKNSKMIQRQLQMLTQ